MKIDFRDEMIRAIDDLKREFYNGDSIAITNSAHDTNNLKKLSKGILEREVVKMIDKLTILWTTDNEDTAMNMILMYTLKSNQNKWWKECNLITWGPSNKLLCESSEVQKLVKEIMKEGVHVEACQRCAERYGLVDQLTEMGIEVKLMGEPLTGYLKDENCRVISI